MKHKSLITIIFVAVLVGAIAFFGGMQYQKTQSPMMGPNRTLTAEGGRMMTAPNGERRMGGARPAQGMGMTMGEVTSVDDSSVTLKLQDGSSKIINLQSSTSYSKAAEGSKADIKTGERLAVFGEAGSDGSINAETVQLNPTTGMMLRGGSGQGATQSR